MPSTDGYGFALEGQVFFLYDTETQMQDDGAQLSEWATLLSDKIRANSGEVETLFPSF